MPTTEQQLRLYRQLVEHSLGLMCIHDLEGVLLAINPAAAESLGYSVSEGEGRNLGDFLAPSVRPLFPRYLQRLRQNGADSGLMRLVAKDGSQRVWMYRNVLYSEGSDTHVLGQATDVTERIAIESALKQAHRELTQVRDELTDRVARRTEALEKANEELKAEMEHRAQMQEELIQAKKLESVALLAAELPTTSTTF